MNRVMRRGIPTGVMGGIAMNEITRQYSPSAIASRLNRNRLSVSGLNRMRTKTKKWMMPIPRISPGKDSHLNFLSRELVKPTT